MRGVSFRDHPAFAPVRRLFDRDRDDASADARRIRAELQARLAQLDLEMTGLRRRAEDPVVCAVTWAQRSDAILARTPPELRPWVERRLQRIGVRWGLAAGVRLSGQYPAFRPIRGSGRGGSKHR